MVKGKQFTITSKPGRPNTTRQQPSTPRTPFQSKGNERPDLVFSPDPSAPLDHERNQPSPVGKPTPEQMAERKAKLDAIVAEYPQPKKVVSMTNVNPANYPQASAGAAAMVKATAKKSNTDTLPSESEVAKLMPTLPAEFRNNEIYRKRAYYYQQAAELGKTAAKGELTLIALAEKATDGSIEGALAPSDEYTHALEMFHHFQNARVKAKPLTEDSIKNKARQLNWFIRLGSHYGADAKRWFNEMVDMHDTIAQDPSQLKSMKYTAVYEDVNNLVRKQMMKVDDEASKPLPTPVPLMNEEEARTYVFKSSPEQETAVDLLISAFKALEKANEGRKENEKKQIPARAGLNNDDIRLAMQTVQDVASELSAEEKAEFMKATSHKKPSKKKASTTANTSQGAASNQATPVPGNGQDEEEVEVPEGFYLTADGELSEIPDGYYPTGDGNVAEIPQGYLYDTAAGGLVEEQ